MEPIWNFPTFSLFQLFHCFPTFLHSFIEMGSSNSSEAASISSYSHSPPPSPSSSPQTSENTGSTTPRTSDTTNSSNLETCRISSHPTPTQSHSSSNQIEGTPSDTPEMPKSELVRSVSPQSDFCYSDGEVSSVDDDDEDDEIGSGGAGGIYRVTSSSSINELWRDITEVNETDEFLGMGSPIGEVRTSTCIHSIRHATPPSQTTATILAPLPNPVCDSLRSRPSAPRHPLPSANARPPLLPLLPPTPTPPPDGR